MILERDVASLSHEEYRAYFYRERAAFARRMAEYDRIEAEMDTVPRAPVDDAIADLAALGVANPAVAYGMGVIATRVWLLEIASDGKVGVDTPAGEYQLFRYVMLHARLITNERQKRRFGGKDMTAGDVEEARLRLEIDIDLWNKAHSRAAWVLRGL